MELLLFYPRPIFSDVCSPNVGRTLANDGGESALRMRAELSRRKLSLLSLCLLLPPLPPAVEVIPFGSFGDSWKRSLGERGQREVFSQKKHKHFRMHVAELLLFCEVLKKRRKFFFKWGANIFILNSNYSLKKLQNRWCSLNILLCLLKVVLQVCSSFLFILMEF